MLGAEADENALVIARLLTLCAWTCCGLVVASFALFADGQLSAGSSHQAAEVLGSSVPAATALTHPRPEAQPRRFIDGAAAALRSPFDGLVHAKSAWVRRGVPTLLALILYGFGLGYLSRLLRMARLPAPAGRISLR